MKFVGLLSGGKDSMFALSKAIQMGHECLCVASLFSATEKDSYMFQSAGTNLVAALAKAMDKPYCVRKLRGASLCQDLHYRPTDKDEVEDLKLLLEEVKWRFPGVQAVVSGAVLSDYQRLRVEHVCRDLGLMSVSPLWKLDQSQLLNEMIESGFDAVLVKISAIGLTPRHLNKPIAELRDMFEGLHKKFGFNVCGEGGEYETLMLDAPFFKKRLVIQETVTHDSEYSECMPTAYLEITKAALEDKDTGELEPVPDISKHLAPVKLFTTADFFSSGEITAKGLGYEAHSIEEEAFIVLRGLQESLTERGLSFSQVYYVHAYINDMALFARFNGVYARFFGFNSPPARFCIQVDQDVRVKLFVQGSTLSKEVLQVASISSWAPAAIGPYSQASRIEEELHMAGMIPLDPTSMNISPLGLEQTFLSLRQVANHFKFQIDRPHVCVAYYTDAIPVLDPMLLPCYVKVAALPKNADHEIELHLNKTIPAGVSTSQYRETTEDYSFSLASLRSVQVVWGTWIIQVEEVNNHSSLINKLQEQLESYFEAVKHKSVTTRAELVDSRNWSPRIEDYIKEFRIYDPAPYSYKQDWLDNFPTLYLHSETRVIYIVLEDWWQVASQRYINSAA